MKYLILVIPFLVGCYSFKGVTIPLEAVTFSVRDFDNTANQVVPGLSEDLTERLKNKVRSNSKLTYDADNPDIVFYGSIQAYDVQSIAAQGNQQSALNQVTLKVKVTYEYDKDEKVGWDRSFSRKEEFDSGDNLLDRQEALNDLLLEQLIEDIFNAAFAEKW